MKLFGASGFVIGALDQSGLIDLITMRGLIDEIGPGHVITFHRAYDVAVDAHVAALDALDRLGFDYVLTSGRARDVTSGLDQLLEMEKIIKNKNLKISILAGGGVSTNSIENILKFSKISNFHGSFSKKEFFENSIFDLGQKYLTQSDLVKQAKVILDNSVQIWFINVI